MAAIVPGGSGSVPGLPAVRFGERGWLLDSRGRDELRSTDAPTTTFDGK